MKTITFYSYKGGVGRTLALANIAKRLSEFNKKVCLIDFDLEAPGIPYKFKNYINIAKIKSGIVDYISNYQETCIPPKSIIDYSISFKLDLKSKHDVTIIPSGNSSYQEYWSNLSTINWTDLLYRDNSHGVEFFLDLKSKIKEEINPDVLLIDARTGISEISGIPLSILADEVVLVVSNNEENIHGITQIINSLTNPELRLKETESKITLVLSRIPHPDKPQDKVDETNLVKSILRKINQSLHEKKNAYKVEELVILHSERDLELNESFKIGHENTNIQSISTDYLSLFSKLTNDILNPSEIKQFETIKQAEKYYNSSMNTSDTNSKIKYLKEAIKLNKNQSAYHYRLSLVYEGLHNYEESLKEINKALALMSNNINYYSHRMGLYYRLSLSDSLFNDANKIMELAPNIYSGYFGVALYHAMENRDDESLEWYSKAIEIDPEEPTIYNNRACGYLKVKNFDKAFEDVYKALSLDIDSAISYSTLAEINYELGNLEEFYKNIEIAVKFGIDVVQLVRHEKVYKKLKHDNRFITILEKYNKQDAIDMLN